MLAIARLIIVFLIASGAARAQEPECSVSGSLPDGSIFIGYTRPNESQLNTLALVVSGQLESYDGRNLSAGLTLYEAASEATSEREISELTPYLNRLGNDHCVYLAQLSGSTADAWRLWSSEVTLILRAPSPTEREAFRELMPDCISQGDTAVGQEQCTYPILVAVSDIDEDGGSEYWHTTPYLWDIGLSVSELETSTGLRPIISGCPGCSD